MEKRKKKNSSDGFERNTKIRRKVLVRLPNLQQIIIVNAVKNHCPNKDFSLEGAIKFQMGLSRRKKYMIVRK